MKVTRIWLCLSLILFPFIGLSNGGPIDLGYLRKTGNIRLLRKADVLLLKENLHIKLIRDYTEIEVEYTLQNNGNAQNIQYGFPVDAYAADWCHCLAISPFNEENNFIKYFKITANEQELKLSHWVIDNAYLARAVYLKGSYRDEEAYAIVRKWYATTISFQAGEIKTLRVVYKLRNTIRDIIEGLKFVPQHADRHFTYHLTPSSNWGDGIVKDFNLTIDMTNLDSLKAEYRIKGIDSLENNNHIYTYKTQNYNLKKSDRIDVHYNYNHVKLSDFMQKKELPKSLIKSIRCSSNDSTAKNLIDDNPFTTWTGKAGDWIEIQFHKVRSEHNQEYSIMPKGIFALNGDYSNQISFDKSGKISVAKVTINDTLAYADIGEVLEGKVKLIRLDKPIIKEVNKEHIKGLATLIADGESLTYFDRINYIYKIRIEIVASTDKIGKEVTLSELYFVRYIHK